METGIKQNEQSYLTPTLSKGEGEQRLTQSYLSQTRSGGEGEVGTAAMLKRLAATHMRQAAEHDRAVRVWADGLTSLVWRPWGGWKVRYAPIGGGENGPVETVFIAGDILLLIAQSPGALVQVVDAWGDVEERVIGAFLDATPVDFAEPRTDRHMDYHRPLTVPTFNDWVVVNIPAVVTQAELGAIAWTDAPAMPSWQEVLAGAFGAAAEQAWISLPDVLERSEAELAAHWWVQGVDRCHVTE